MTPEQIALVENSLTELEAELDDLVAGFYRHLFHADPTVEAMFSTEPAEQRAKFAQQLTDIVRSVREHDRFLAEATELGARHATYGVRAAHYETAERALLATLADRYGDAWTDELEAAWHQAYDLTAEAMLAGASRSEDRGSGPHVAD